MASTPAEPQDTGAQRLSTRVLEAVAEEEGTSPIEFDRRLSEVIDPDALDRLFQPEGAVGRVEFQYLGYRVVAQGDGRITVTEQDG